MHNSITIPKITSVPAGEVPAGAASVSLEHANWADRYPSNASVTLRLWHDGQSLCIHSEVSEPHVRGTVAEDNGEVWTDSCIEFFFTTDGDGYYNFETNCIGRMVASYRKGRNEGVEFASPAVLAAIKRNPSLGETPFGTVETAGTWNMSVRLPLQAFFKHGIESLDGLEARGNFYKCGDLLPAPHFLSWCKVDVPDPDFHRPEFFGRIVFGN